MGDSALHYQQGETVLVSINVKPGSVAVPEWLNARFPIEREAVMTQATDLKPRQWMKVKLSTLQFNPRDHELYTTAVYFAKKFIHDMALQGFGLLTAESDLMITGPYAHLESDTHRRGVGRHWGQEQTEQYADFRITGQFLRARPITFEY